eukprot:6959099-Prymnesium_polylepis.1
MRIARSPSHIPRSCSSVGSASSTPPMRQRRLCRVRLLELRVAPWLSATSALRKPVCDIVAHMARQETEPMSPPEMLLAEIMPAMMSLVSGAT